MGNSIVRFYHWLVLDHAKITLLILTAIAALLISQIPKFRTDVSTDSFLLQNDADLVFTREISKIYGGDAGDMLVISFKPSDKDVFSEESLEKLRLLREDIKAIPGISHVLTILDAPLIMSPKGPIAKIAENTRTLEEERTDINLAREEFKNSPFYKNFIVNKRQDTTGIVIMRESDKEYGQLENTRNLLLNKKVEGTLSKEEALALKNAIKTFDAKKDSSNRLAKDTITQVRAVMDKHRTDSTMFLGGVSMVIVDALKFINDDLKVFGIGALIFIVLALGVFFMQLRFIIIPLICCTLAAVMTTGWLSWFEIRINPITSNFPSLVAIITMAVIIHLIVRYRELHYLHPNEDQRTLVADATRLMFLPCFFTVLTTVVAFFSLILADIIPVAQFGLIMAVGISIGFSCCFLLFPSVLVLLPKGKAKAEKEWARLLTRFFAYSCEKHRIFVLLLCIVTFGLCIYGGTQLTVENRFIDYFQKDTEIYQGMVEIDTELGGTTPIDVIINAPANHMERLNKESQRVFVDDDDDDDDEWDDLADDGGDYPLGNSYFYTPTVLEKLIDIHEYLESLAETGQVRSIAAFYQSLKILNDNQPLNPLFLQVVYNSLNANLKSLLISPFIDEDGGNQVRFTIRVIDSQKNLSRKELIEKIETDIIEKFDIAPENLRLSNFVVLFNNLLQSLYRSQIETLGLVFLGIMIMMMLLFRSFKIAIIAVMPNIFSAALVLGVMGLTGLPLDLMTITVAAITIGIAVDDTIHYVHRFREEIKVDWNYSEAMHRSHNTIGMAMYYTSLTIMFGFSIMAFSNFNPTVHFGLLTCLAMFVALLANLTLLPVLMMIFKPMGKQPANFNYKNA